MITERQALEIARKHKMCRRDVGSPMLSPYWMAFNSELLAAFREVERITAEACAALDVNMDATEQEHAGEARGFHAGVNAYRRSIRAMLPAPTAEQEKKV